MSILLKIKLKIKLQHPGLLKANTAIRPQDGAHHTLPLTARSSGRLEGGFVDREGRHLIGIREWGIG